MNDLQHYVLFNSISVMSGRWAGENKRLCNGPRLRLKRSPSQAGHEQVSAFKPNELPDPWLVCCVGFNGPLRQYFSLYRAVSQREGE